MKPYLKFPSPEEWVEEETNVIIPKTERVVPTPRTEGERVAIALEYFSSYLVWLDRLSEVELKLLNTKLKDMMIPSNGTELNRTLRIMYDVVERRIGENDVT